MWYNIDENCYTTLEPIEWLVRSSAVPTVVAVGMLDEYCTPGFFNYLKEIARENEFVRFAVPVKDAKHAVTADDPKSVVIDYERALFGANG